VNRDEPSGPIVVDASVGIALLKDEPAAASIREALGHWQSLGTELAVPGLFWLEIINILAREGRPARETLTAVEALEELGLRTVEPDPAMRLLVMDFCERYRLTAYDSLYLALADVMGGRLATLDRVLARAAGARAVFMGGAGRHPLHEAGGEYSSEPTWPRWSGTSAYLARLRAQAEEAARSARS